MDSLFNPPQPQLTPAEITAQEIRDESTELLNLMASKYQNIRARVVSNRYGLTRDEVLKELGDGAKLLLELGSDVKALILKADSARNLE